MATTAPLPVLLSPLASPCLPFATALSPLGARAIVSIKQRFLMMGIGGSGRSSLIKYYQPPLPSEPLEDFYLRSILYNLLVAMDQALGLLRENHTCEIPPEVDAWHVQNHARLPGY